MAVPNRSGRPPSDADESSPPPRISYWGAVWQRFSSNRLAVLSLGFVIVMILVAALADFIAPYGYNQIDLDNAYQSPSWRHVAGTDEVGRDIFSRLIFSLQTALAVAFGAAVISVAIGGLIGAVAGYAGGVVDNLLMRFTDVMYAFPGFLFSIILVSVLGRGIVTIFIAIAATGWVGFARLMRAQVLSIKNLEYVESARALGATHRYAIRRYILPNSFGPLIVAIAFMVPTLMMTESALSLLGLGVMPPRPSWGVLIQVGSLNFRAFPYQLTWPAATFALALLAFTYLGDGLNDAFNPKE